MADFSKFAALVKAKFDEMSKGELFTVNIDGRTLADCYLAFFPEGTNPQYRERTEHDCSCCRNFLKNIGNVVAIVDNKLMSVWDVEGAESPYAEVAAQLRELVEGQTIAGIFRKGERKFGVSHNYEALSDNTTTRWDHLYGVIADRHFTEAVGTAVGEYGSSAKAFGRGLADLKADAVETVIELITSNSIYRGEEFLEGVRAFQRTQQKYAALSEQARALFVWENAGNPGSRFRSSAIGTLVEDLSEGMPLDDAVKMYEAKVAPENYKRTTAAITPRMVQDALATINALGLEPMLHRRPARLSDISINNVLWVDNSVQGKMKDGLEGLLMGAVAKPAPNLKGAESITIDEFMEKVLPQATSMEVLVRNGQQSNFMTLTAPEGESTGRLFKWDNDFAWSYSGDVADSLRQRVQAAGGRVDGALRFSHTWNYDPENPNQSLMDLHVFMPGSYTKRANGGDEIHDNYPSGRRVGWNCRNDHASGGTQDVDYTRAPGNFVPVENITFPTVGRMPEGKYLFKIHNWSLRQPTKSGFKAEIEFGGQVFHYEHAKALKNKQWITLAEVTLKNGMFSIEHLFESTTSSLTKWGITTETFVKVNTVMKSPNHWDGNAVGNRHWFFMLEGCKNDQPIRGIYNEFLNPALDKHRKVFEVLGSKMMCQPTDDQLSGIGFSSTRSDTVVVNVTGNKLRKTYNITF